MKVPWFSNVLLPEAAKPLGLPVFLKAGWLRGYLGTLGGSGEVSVTVAVCSGEPPNDARRCRKMIEQRTGTREN